MFNSYEYGYVVEEYFKQITRMNKPNLYSEFKNDPLPLNAFLGIMTFACQNDYVDIVKYFYENNVKGVSKNITVNFYFTYNIVEHLYNVAKNKNSVNVEKYLRNMNYLNSDEDKMYEMLIHLSKDKKNVSELTNNILNHNGSYIVGWGYMDKNIFNNNNKFQYKTLNKKNMFKKLKQHTFLY
jgi:hypothetical protein